MKKRERVAEEGQKKEREGEKCPELFEQHTRAGGYNWQLAYVCSPIFRPGGRGRGAGGNKSERWNSPWKRGEGLEKKRRGEGGKKKRRGGRKRKKRKTDRGNTGVERKCKRRWNRWEESRARGRRFFTEISRSKYSANAEPTSIHDFFKGAPYPFISSTLVPCGLSTAGRVDRGLKLFSHSF